MNVILTRAEGYTDKPGHWWRQEHEGKVAVYVTCQHGHAYPAMIFGHKDPAKNWQIDAQGRVTPSIWIKGDCDWHVFATLAGWGHPAPVAQPNPDAENLIPGDSGRGTALGIVALIGAFGYFCAALGAAACAPLPRCKDIKRSDGSVIEVCEKRVCRDVSKGVFVPCPEERP